MLERDWNLCFSVLKLGANINRAGKMSIFRGLMPFCIIIVIVYEVKIQLDSKSHDLHSYSID